MKGMLEIVTKSADTGKVIQHRICKNTIVTGLLEQIIQMLGGNFLNGTDYRHISKLVVGTGSMSESVSDEYLQIPITPEKFVIPTFINAGTDLDYVVKFNASLLRTEANGFPIAEAGLVCADGTLAARKTFTGINKTSDIVLDFFWRISA